MVRLYSIMIFIAGLCLYAYPASEVSSQEITGEWVCVMDVSDDDTLESTAGDIGYVIYENSKYIMTIGSKEGVDTVSGTWKISKDSLILTSESGKTSSKIELKGDMLFISGSGYNIGFKRKEDIEKEKVRIKRKQGDKGKGDRKVDGKPRRPVGTWYMIMEINGSDTSLIREDAGYREMRIFDNGRIKIVTNESSHGDMFKGVWSVSGDTMRFAKKPGNLEKGRRNNSRYSISEDTLFFFSKLRSGKSYNLVFLNHESCSKLGRGDKRLFGEWSIKGLLNSDSLIISEKLHFEMDLREDLRFSIEQKMPDKEKITGAWSTYDDILFLNSESKDLKRFRYYLSNGDLFLEDTREISMPVVLEHN